MSPTTASLLVAAGGAVGALLRHWAGLWIGSLHGTGLPFSTLAVNVAGGFAIGVLATLAAHHPPALLFGVTGVLGGFTTFSAFSLETLRLIETGRVALALLYAGASVVLCVAAAALGAALARTTP